MDNGNLIPLNERSKDDAKEIQRLGGIARGRQRREQRTMREAAQDLLNSEVEVKMKDGTTKQLQFRDAITQKFGADALKNLKLETFKYIVQLAGEEPKPTVDVKVSQTPSEERFAGLPDDVLYDIADKAQQAEHERIKREKGGATE
jgi:hypothetical protein